VFALLEPSRRSSRCLRNTHIRHRSASEQQLKAKRICLLQASHERPPGVYAWHKGRLGLGWCAIPIKVKTITATTGLAGIADAFGTAILGRSALCTDSRDISTIWHPKRVMKTTESHETGGSPAGNVETCTYNSLGHSRHRRK